MYTHQKLIDLYLSWANDFLTVPVFADYHGLTEDQAQSIIRRGKVLYFANNPKERSHFSDNFFSDRWYLKNIANIAIVNNRL